MDNTNEIPDDAIYMTIRGVLDEWKDTELNINSDTARHLLALAVHERMRPLMQDTIENILCPERLVDY